MSNKKEKILVPKLRFEEFQGNWSRELFGKYVLESAFGPRFSSSLYERSGGIATLRTTDMDMDGNISYSTMPNANLLVDDFKDHILEENDIVISRSGTIGITGIFKKYNRPVIPGAFLIRFRIDVNAVCSDFIKQYFNSSFGRNKLNKLSAGGVQKNLTGTSVKNAEVSFPILPEQQKIAVFLSAVDEKIQQLRQKKALLEKYKKGVMQKLFPKKAGQASEVRFKKPDGSNYPDWEEKKLGEIGEIVSGLTYSPKDIVEEGTLVLRSSNVKEGRLSFDDKVLVNVGDNFNPVKEGDVLICVRNGSKRLIGKSAVITKEAEGCAFGAFMTIYRSPFNNFLAHYFQSTPYYKNVHRNLGATINSINGSDLKKFKVHFPSKEEQQKIADFLSGIDQKINQVETQINQTQTFKKGLLQQMFV